MTLFGFLAGLVAGLGIAAAAALYLTSAPLPFVNKVQPSTENVTPDTGDPNRSLFSPHIPTAPAAAAGAAALAETQPKIAATAAAPAGGAQPEAAAGAAPPATPALAAPGAANPPATEQASADGGRLMLQVGAYKTADDADAARARLALLGLDAQVTQVQADGTTLYRVRLGPYGQLDDLNGIRRTLSENGMEPQLVHLH